MQTRRGLTRKVITFMRGQPAIKPNRCRARRYGKRVALVDNVDRTRVAGGRGDGTGQSADRRVDRDWNFATTRASRRDPLRFFFRCPVSRCW